MSGSAAAVSRLAAIDNLTVSTEVRLSEYTRFGIGGPAAVLCQTADARAALATIRTLNQLDIPRVVISGGSNLVVSDSGFDGVVIRFTGAQIERNGMGVSAGSGTALQALVDASIDFGFKGLETLTGIPGDTGGAVYGNAGAYGHSMQEIVESVYATDGKTFRTFSNADCEFLYRESFFKRDKRWLILWTKLHFAEGEREVLVNTAREIRAIRDKKYPPDMKCAGSIFKNLFFAELPAAAQREIPPTIVREGKVPSAWFLDQTGVRGMRLGDIQVASYHANLIYNLGAGTAADLVIVIRELKRRVRERFGFNLEEEVQYVGFDATAPSRLGARG